MAAELVHPDFERDPGAGGTLGEDHRQGLTRKRALLVLAFLHTIGEVEEGRELGLGEVGDGEEVAWRHTRRPVRGASFWQGNRSLRGRNYQEKGPVARLRILPKPRPTKQTEAPDTGPRSLDLAVGQLD